MTCVHRILVFTRRRSPAFFPLPFPPPPSFIYLFSPSPSLPFSSFPPFYFSPPFLVSAALLHHPRQTRAGGRPAGTNNESHPHHGPRFVAASSWVALATPFGAERVLPAGHECYPRGWRGRAGRIGAAMREWCCPSLGQAVAGSVQCCAVHGRWDLYQSPTAWGVSRARGGASSRVARRRLFVHVRGKEGARGPRASLLYAAGERLP